MCIPLTIRISILVVLLVLVPPALAQPKSSGVDPQKKPRRIKQEPDKAFKEWVQDVGPIIRPDELKAWNALQTNEEREQFIGEFWRLRDPDQDTEENEYREGYYERVEYANEHSARASPE